MKVRHAAVLALVGWYHRCSVGILPIHADQTGQDSEFQNRQGLEIPKGPDNALDR
jgi:hypothetical protein